MFTRLHTIFLYNLFLFFLQNSDFLSHLESNGIRFSGVKVAFRLISSTRCFLFFLFVPIYLFRPPVTLNLLRSKHSLVRATKLRHDDAQWRGGEDGEGRERRRIFFPRLSRKSLSHESRPRLGTEGRERERELCDDVGRPRPGHLVASK